MKTAVSIDPTLKFPANKAWLDRKRVKLSFSWSILFWIAMQMTLIPTKGSRVVSLNEILPWSNVSGIELALNTILQLPTLHCSEVPSMIRTNEFSRALLTLLELLHVKSNSYWMNFIYTAIRRFHPSFTHSIDHWSLYLCVPPRRLRSASSASKLTE